MQIKFTKLCAIFLKKSMDIEISQILLILRFRKFLFTMQLKTKREQKMISKIPHNALTNDLLKFLRTGLGPKERVGDLGVSTGYHFFKKNCY